VQRGREAAAILADDARHLDPEQEGCLRALQEEGGRAHGELVRANLALVVYVAKRYRASGVPLLDLIQEGNIGLLRAAERFDPSRGVRFSTHAVWWIRQAIQSGITRNAGTIHLPEHVRKRMSTLQRTITDLALRLARQPSNGEVGRELGLDARQVAEVLSLPWQLGSLEKQVGADSASRLSDLIEDRLASSPLDAAVVAMLPGEIARLLSVLDERERRIMRLRFGLGGEEPLTLKAIAERLELTPERVRQIEARALAKLRTAALNRHR
jgi:RNA polymerase sigma factor (sigma-70 family)